MFKKKLLTGVSVLVMLQACSTFDPYTGEKKTSKTAIGAGVGASVAAAIAYINNRDEDGTTRRQRIMKAATVGGVIGGSAGYYMDSQEAKLRNQLGRSGVSVQRDGNNINLIMPGNIAFSTNNADINANFYEVLNSVALVLQEFDKTIVVVTGHTDNLGSTALNQRLSQQRASSVSSYFLSKNILADRLETVGAGESQPIASNNTKAGRDQNRRVEITLLPIDGQS